MNGEEKIVEEKIVEEKIGYKQIIKQTEYMKTVIAAVINRFGDSIDSIAMTWLVYQLTQSASWSAIIFGVNRIPTIFLQPFAGAAIEGKNKKQIMIVTDIIRGLCVGFIATALMLGFLNQWLLLLTTIIISCAEAFRGPASSSLIPKLLEKKYYAFGLSLNSSACSTMELIGLGAAGVLLSMFPVSVAIYIDMVTFFLSALIIFTLRIKETNLVKGRINAKEYVQNLKGGFSYLKNDALLRYFVLLAIFLNAVLVPFNSLQATLISEVLKLDEAMLSVLGVAITVGMILGAALYPYLSSKLSKQAIASLGGYSIGIYYLMFVFVGRYVTSEFAIYTIVSVVSLITGIAFSQLMSFCNVEFIKNIKGEYLARVTSIFGACCVAAIPVVSFVIGALAKVTSTAVLFLITGILDVIICIGLCSRKRFAAMDTKEEGVIADGEEASDSTAC
ncbi:MAG: transporter [Firmicutes bacterium]|nr:transporter [Bacillota bacterium]